MKNSFTRTRLAIWAIYLLSFQVHAICMQDYDAIVYNCVPIEDAESSKLCSEKHGEGFLAYYASNVCTEELAADLRGDEYSSEEVLPQTVPASCLSYETAQKHACQLWDYEAAYNYCANNYGDRYLPYIPSDQCSLELAEKEAGFIDPTRLIEGLEEKMVEAEGILFLIDRNDMKESLSGLISSRPIVKNEFYTDIMTGLLTKLKIIKKEIYERSFYKVRFDAKEVEKFRELAFRYLGMVGRIHQVYAFVAHNNHKVLSSYSFEKLSYLNLKVKKTMGLELISKVNMKVRNIDNETVEIYESEQNKELYEYMALSEPTTESDYAKLVTFLGIRENLVNLWAVDRMTKVDLLRDRLNSCGNFLSYRGEGPISSLPTVMENQQYDLFYNDYLKREEEIKEKLKEITPVSRGLVTQILLTAYQNQPEMKQLLSEYYNHKITDEMITKHFTEDAKLIVDGLKKDLESFTEYHFRTFVMPGDDILNKKVIYNQVTNSLLERVKYSLPEYILGAYPWISNKAQAEIEKLIEARVSDDIADQLEVQVGRKLRSLFLNYGKNKKFAEINFDKKVDEVYAIARENAKNAALAVKMDDRKINHRNIKLAPGSIEELMGYFELKLGSDFHDVKLTLEKNQKLSLILKGFFEKLTEEFNKEYLVQTDFNKFKLKGTDGERAQALWDILFKISREYFEKNEFQVTQTALVPNATMLSRDREELSNNPYTIKVYEDGTPVTVHVNQFYKAFQEKIDIEIPWRDIGMRMGSSLFGIEEIEDYGKRSNRDYTTDGTFGRPRSYIATRGRVYYGKDLSYIGYESLKRQYLMSLDITKDEISANNKIIKQQERMLREQNEQMYEDAEIIKRPQRLFARIFELFKLPIGSIANNYNHASFNLDKDEKKHLLKTRLSKAYGESPLLRNEIKTEENRQVYNTSYWGGITTSKTVSEEVERPLLLKVGLHAYQGGVVNENRAKDLIRKVIYQARREVKGKLGQFCQGKYLDYENDQLFKQNFKASAFLRETLKHGQDMTKITAARIRRLDHKVAENIRSPLEAANEDYIENSLIYLGIVTFIAIGVMFSIGTMGIAAPGTIGMLGLFLSASNYVFLPLIVASTYSRLNTQFYEVPAQLKFQTSLAHSQVDAAKIADYDLIEEAAKDNRVNKYWTMGFLPLDLYFGHSVVKQFRTFIGTPGIRSYEKLTGMKFRNYSAPPQTMRENVSYRQLRQQFGVVKGALYRSKIGARNLMLKLPKYQFVPEELIKTAPLRMGIARAFKSKKIDAKPWVINDEIKQYHSLYDNRLKTYMKYSMEEANFIEHYYLKKGLTLKEKFVNGFSEYSKFGFTVKSFFKSIKERRLISYLKEYGDLMKQLKEKQLQVVKSKAERLEKMIIKIDEFKSINENSFKSSEQLVDDFLRMFTDEEISLFREIGKKIPGFLKGLKTIFKHHDEILRSLKPVQYQSGVPFANKKEDLSDFLDYERDIQYSFKNEREDLVNFYESVMRQSYVKDQRASDQLSKEIEQKLSTMFIVDRYGNRIYK